MNAKLLADLIPAAILLGMGIIGGVRGFFKTLANALAGVVSVIGAVMLSKRLSAPLALRLYPKIGSALQEKLADLTLSQSDSGLVNALIRRALEQANDEIASAVISVLQIFLQVLLLVILFFVLLALTKLVIRLIDKVFDLPVLRTANSLSGFLLGLLEGAVLLLFLLSAAKSINPTAIAQQADGTYLLSFFLNFSPTLLLGALLG